MTGTAKAGALATSPQPQQSWQIGEKQLRGVDQVEVDDRACLAELGPIALTVPHFSTYPREGGRGYLP